MKRVYLDYAASAPVASEVLRAMLPYLENSPARRARRRVGVAGWGNPGSLHYFGQEAMLAVDESRETIAKAIGADFREIIFTGSATEANNLALRGVIKRITNNELRIKERGKTVIHNSSFFIPRIIVSAIEHESVLETARDLEKDGAEVVYLPINRDGVVDLEALKNALNERAVLVSVMYANNEIGTIQPISEIAKIIGDFRKQTINNQEQRTGNFPLFHTDAAQAFQFLDCNAENLGVDLMTLSAHKIYGPKGVGALFVKNQKSPPKAPCPPLAGDPPTAEKINPFYKLRIDGERSRTIKNQNREPLNSILTGGGQEFGMRSGTENVPGIVGFAKAVELLFSSSQEYWNKKISSLRDYFWQELRRIYPAARINADTETRINADDYGRKPMATLPNILNVYFPNHEAQFLLTKLDLAGVAASSGSACRSRATESSYVIEALGYSRERAKRSIRFSFGRPTTKKEIDDAFKAIKRGLQTAYLGS